MKKVITSFIGLFSIANSVLAYYTNPNTSSVIAVSVYSSNVAISFTAANNTRFEIERSFYSNNFTVIASVNSVFAGNFKINDNPAELAGRKFAYYRVKTITADGNFSYSNTTVVKLEAAEGAIVTKSTINFTAAQNGNAAIEVKNAAGKTITVKKMIASRGNNIVELTNGLAKGMYTATISVNGVTVDMQKVIAE